MDMRLALMCGTDIPIIECQLTVHQPQIKEIAFLGEDIFFAGVQTLCLSKTMFSQDKTVLEQINNFQIFMAILNEAEAKDKKQAVMGVLKLLFPDNNIIFTPRGISVMGENSSVNIDETNFEPFQNILKQIFCFNSGHMDQTSFNPGGTKAKEIADKLMRGRQRVAAEKGELNTSVFTQYLSILTIGLSSMSLQNLEELTMFQLYDLIERYNLYINWDIDVRSRLAGGKPDHEPDNWMKNIH